MFKLRRFAPVWITLGVVFLTGCASKEVTASDITGIWVENPATADLNAAVDCAVFEFREDGTFEANNLPRAYFIPNTALDLPRVKASGTWTIEKLGETQFVDIVIEPNLEWLYSAARHSTLYLSADGPQRTLYAWAKDPNERLYLVKQDTTDCAN
jgi:hypothetical protein